MIVVTGGAGFIGFNLVKRLIKLGYNDIVVIDNNYPKKSFNKFFHNVKYLNVEDSYIWLPFNKYEIEVIFHLGARTDTMEMNEKFFKRLNLNYSKFIWNLCSEVDIPLIYASSAATYGDGQDGFNDEDSINNLKPLNPYGWSKHNFDLHVLDDTLTKSKPSFWYGLKFFNVYGNHEQHKGSMASVIWHLYLQIKQTGKVNLFKSNFYLYENGEQRRDFIHVDDIVNILINIYENKINIPSNIYNLGTGTARTYNDLAKEIFNVLGKEPSISYIDIPMVIKDSYQSYTKAKMDKLLKFIPNYKFISLEKGIQLYIKQLEDENCKHYS